MVRCVLVCLAISAMLARLIIVLFSLFLFLFLTMFFVFRSLLVLAWIRKKIGTNWWVYLFIYLKKYISQNWSTLVGLSCRRRLSNERQSKNTFTYQSSRNLPHCDSYVRSHCRRVCVAVGVVVTATSANSLRYIDRCRFLIIANWLFLSRLIQGKEPVFVDQLDCASCGKDGDVNKVIA